MKSLSQSLFIPLIAPIRSLEGTLWNLYRTDLLSHSLSVRLIAFHRGNGCYPRTNRAGTHRQRLSVPFSSGQWLLHDDSGASPDTRQQLSVPFSSGIK